MSDQALNHSQFYMWRTVIAMAHADGYVCSDERSYFETIFNNLKNATSISDEQLATLESDLTNKQDPADMFAHIEEPQFRGQAVDFARVLAYKDGNACPDEQAILAKLHGKAMDKVDPNAVNIDSIRQSLEQRSKLESAEDLANLNDGKGVPLGDLLGRFLNAVR